MNSITLLNTGVATLGVVDLPGNAKNMHIKDFGSGDVLIYEKEFGHSPIPLPPGNWSILGWSDEITEEQAKELMPGWNDFYPKFKGDNEPLYMCREALESFNSWLLSNGITERKLILKQVK